MLNGKILIAMDECLIEIKNYSVFIVLYWRQGFTIIIYWWFFVSILDIR